MATLHVQWVAISHPQQGIGPGLIESIGTTGEALTTSGTSAATTATAPRGAEYAICTSLDAGHYVTVGSSPTATAANGICVMTGAYQVLPVSFGDKIAAKTV